MLVSGVEIRMNLSTASMILSVLLHLQYDPEAKNCPNLFYHFIDEQVPDILIAKIHKNDIHRATFHVSDDYKYLILCDSQMVSIAAIDSINKRIRFKSIFTVSQDTFYVNISSHFLLILTKIFIIHLKTSFFLTNDFQEYVGNDGEYFVFLTNDRAPRRCIVEIEIGKGNPVKHMEVIVPVCKRLRFLNTFKF